MIGAMPDREVARRLVRTKKCRIWLRLLRQLIIYPRYSFVGVFWQPFGENQVKGARLSAKPNFSVILSATGRVRVHRQHSVLTYRF